MTNKQRRFVEEYLVDYNATQAAIRAGYSRKTAKSIGSENLTKLEIKSYIDKKLKELHDENTADAKELLEYFTSVVRGESKSEIVVVEGKGDGHSSARGVRKSPDEKERLKAAEILAKMLGLFDEKLKLELEPITIINDLTE